MHNKFLLWHGCRPTSLAAAFRDGLKLPSKESSDTGLMFGKGIYLTDCFSKAASQCMPIGADKETMQGVVFLAEAALGDMHKAYQPESFKRGATPFSAHSVYGVGQQKPSVNGLKDIKSNLENFDLDQKTIDDNQALFLNTGRLKENPDLEDKPVGMNVPDLRFNDFVVFDPAQVRLRYALLVDIMAM